VRLLNFASTSSHKVGLLSQDDVWVVPVRRWTIEDSMRMSDVVFVDPLIGELF
jgi:hypothetical protein